MRTSIRNSHSQARISNPALVGSDAGSHPQSEPTALQTNAETREAMIRLVAYSFYERRGLVDGHEVEDWLQAEMEIDRRLSKEETALQSS